jgi:F0F1-type ATP synthase membrane subunit b/b'
MSSAELYLLSFILFLLAVGYPAFTAIRKGLDSYRSKVTTSIMEAEALREQAEALLRKSKRNLSRLSTQSEVEREKTLESLEKQRSEYIIQITKSLDSKIAHQKKINSVVLKNSANKQLSETMDKLLLAIKPSLIERDDVEVQANAILTAVQHKERNSSSTADK